MASLGKIFVYEENGTQTALIRHELEKMGFFVFSSNNLFQFLQYAREVHPDIVIMHFPENFQTNTKDWQEITKKLCRQSCPKIYVNSLLPEEGFSMFHSVRFTPESIKAEQILDILKQKDTKYLH